MFSSQDRELQFEEIQTRGLFILPELLDLLANNLEVETRMSKNNRYRQFDRICWLLAEEYGKKWEKVDKAKPRPEWFLSQIRRLKLFVCRQATKIQKRQTGHSKARVNLPFGWRKSKAYLKVEKKLTARLAAMEADPRRLASTAAKKASKKKA